MKTLFIISLFVFPFVAEANCLHAPPLEAKIKMVSCEEKTAGEIFIYGTLIEVAETERPVYESLKFPFPKTGANYRFYKGLSPFKRNWLWQLKPRDADYCDSLTPGTVINGLITRPCCDANYVWCDPKKSVEFMIDEHKGPTF